MMKCIKGEERLEDDEKRDDGIQGVIGVQNERRGVMGIVQSRWSHVEWDEVMGEGMGEKGVTFVIEKGTVNGLVKGLEEENHRLGEGEI
jgi:hypothetical protein